MHLSGNLALGTMSIIKVDAAPGAPDLSIVKTGAAQANAGETIAYVINYQNKTAGQTATGVQITDRLPSAVSFVSCSGGCSVLGNTITWDLGDVQRASSGTVTYQVMVDPAAINGTTFQNNALIASSQNDPNPTNNQSVVTTKVTNGCIPPTF